MTPKQTLAAHLADRHRRVPLRGTLADLQRAHAHDHWRFVLSHFHWNGTREDVNRSAANRPAGWKTGLDVRERTTA